LSRLSYSGIPVWPILGLVLFGAFFFYAQFGRKAPVYYSDSLGYYSYLPALLLHKNAGRMHETPAGTNLPSSVQGYFETLSQQPLSPNGFAITQYTCGVALMQLPFFGAAHAWAKATAQPANGYSAPYAAAVKCSSFVYAWLGLWLVFRMLRRIFSPVTAATTTALLAVGTNLWWFALHQAGMAHPPAFFLVAALMTLIPLGLQRPGMVVFAGIGACLGLLTLMRPTDLVFLLFPLMVGVSNTAHGRQRIALLWQNPKAVAGAALAFGAVLLPQLLFWKKYAGQWVYYSYIGQGFDWGKPHLLQGIFEFNNGWLAYSPLMMFSIIGIILYTFRRTILRCQPSGIYAATGSAEFTGSGGSEISVTSTGSTEFTGSGGSAISVTSTGSAASAGSAESWIRLSRWFLPVYLYITFSWWCFYYMNGFGARPMIHVYPLLAFPLTLLLEKTWKAGTLWRIGLVCTAGGTVVLSLAFQVQQARGNLFSEQSNAGFAYSTLFKRGLCYPDLVRQDLCFAQPNPDQLQRLDVLAEESFTTTNTVKSNSNYQNARPAGTLVLKPSDEFLSFSLRKVWKDTAAYRNESYDKQWLRCSGRFYAPSENSDLYTQQLLTLQIRRDGQDKAVEWYGCRINNKLGRSDPTDGCRANLFSGKAGVWDEVSFFVPVTESLQQGMILEVGVWNRAGQTLWVDDLQLEHWTTKSD